MSKIVDVLGLDRYLGSIDFTIPTKQIILLQKKVNDWISMNQCGAIVYGKSRSGKTRAIHYISENLKKTYGSDMPIYTYTATDHAPTMKAFYSAILNTIGHEEPTKGTAVQMRWRIVNRMVADAINTQYRRVILFIDEAYLLTKSEYNWLIDIYNELNLSDILLTVLLFGTYELKQQKIGFIRSNKEQIVFRFMVSEFEFKGIISKEDMEMCMYSLDNPFVYNKTDETILMEHFFPRAYTDGKRLGDYSQDLWDAFCDIGKRNNINTNEILMYHFMYTIIYCLKNYGINGKAIYEPTKEDWEDCIDQIGFVSMMSK